MKVPGHLLPVQDKEALSRSSTTQVGRGQLLDTGVQGTEDTVWKGDLASSSSAGGRSGICPAPSQLYTFSDSFLILPMFANIPAVSRMKSRGVVNAMKESY